MVHQVDEFLLGEVLGELLDEVGKVHGRACCDMDGVGGFPQNGELLRDGRQIACHFFLKTTLWISREG